MRICKPLTLDLAAAEKRCFDLVSKAEAQFDDGELPFPFPWQCRRRIQTFCTWAEGWEMLTNMCQAQLSTGPLTAALRGNP